MPKNATTSKKTSTTPNRRAATPHVSKISKRSSYARNIAPRLEAMEPQRASQVAKRQAAKRYSQQHLFVAVALTASVVTNIALVTVLVLG